MKSFLDSKNLTKLATLLLAFFLASSVCGARTNPIVDSVSRISGPSSGGTEVVVNGSNFADGAVVDFNGVAAQTEWVSDTTLNVITPLAAKGSATVSVTNQNGDSGKLNNAFEFIHPGDGVFEDGATLDPPKIMPPDSDFEWDADAGDIDGDGDLDYVRAVDYTPYSVGIYLNNGVGNFTDFSASVPSTNNRPASIDLGDFDNDGDLDIYVAGYHEQDQLYINEGNDINGYPTFSDKTANLPQELTYSWGACLGDFNKDGNLDIYVANGGADRLYLNDGNNPPVFSSASAPAGTTSNSEDCVIADVNGDGFDDIFIVRYDSDNSLYLNTPANPGSFTSTAFPAEPSPAYYGSRDAALNDLDNDGDLDIVIANHNTNQNRLYINDGNPIPTFTDVTSTSLPQIWDNSHDVKAGDVDGDGDVDLVFANQNIYNTPYLNDPQNTLYLNNGDIPPTFSDATVANMPLNLGPSWDVILGDVDNDFDLDIIFTNEGQDQLYLNTP